MATYEDKWFEIWFTEGQDIVPTYLLLVMPDPKDPHQVLILDPFVKYQTVYRAQTYEEAQTWLLEDEYSLVDGRIFPDDGWPDIKSQQSPTQD